MTYRVQFAQTAEDDVRDFVDYVSNELMNPAAAERILSEIEAAATSLRRRPERARLLRSGNDRDRHRRPRGGRRVRALARRRPRGPRDRRHDPNPDGFHEDDHARLLRELGLRFVLQDAHGRLLDVSFKKMSKGT